ncbi:MAG TPA: hypothetical protein ACN46L_06490 [Prochlorococcus sp.]|nr:hypothetical protein [Prochlorococcaceae cyanobacterium ETNP14_MAG_4]
MTNKSMNVKVSEAKEHIPALVTMSTAEKAVHGKSLIGRLNNRIATLITDTVGTMWCAYMFVLLALVSLPDAIQSENPITIVGWCAQTFLQLVLLPIIIVGQNIQAEQSDKRAKTDHKTLTAVHTLTREIHQLSELTDKQLKINNTSERLQSIEEKLSLLLAKSN